MLELYCQCRNSQNRAGLLADDSVRKETWSPCFLLFLCNVSTHQEGFILETGIKLSSDMGVDTFSIVFVAVVLELDGEWALKWLHFC